MLIIGTLTVDSALIRQVVTLSICLRLINLLIGLSQNSLKPFIWRLWLNPVLEEKRHRRGRETKLGKVYSGPNTSKLKCFLRMKMMHLVQDTP